MGWRVLLSEDAERDIEDLYRFIARRDGAETAERILGEIEAAAMSLEEFPERGNIPKELVSIGIGDYREIHHKPSVGELFRRRSRDAGGRPASVEPGKQRRTSVSGREVRGRPQIRSEAVAGEYIC